MKLSKLQKEINKRLNGLSVDLMKHLRTENDLPLLWKDSSHSERIRIDRKAEEVAEGFNEPAKILSDEALNRFDREWEFCFNYDDRSLCTNASYLRSVYQSLKAKNKFEPGEEKLAENTVNYIQSRLLVIADPNYASINPDAFYYVPKEVLRDVAASLLSDGPDAQTLLYEEDDDLVYEGDDVINIAGNPENDVDIDDRELASYLMLLSSSKEYGEKAFASISKTYLGEVIHRNTNDEILYRKDINKEIKNSQTAKKEAAKNYDAALEKYAPVLNDENTDRKTAANARKKLNELDEQYKAAAQREQEYIDVLAETKDKTARRRAVIGACLAERQIDMLGVHNVDEQNLFSSENYCMGLTGPLTDEEINHLMEQGLTDHTQFADAALNLFAGKGVKFPPENAQEYMSLASNLKESGFKYLPSENELNKKTVFTAATLPEVQPAPVDEIAVERRWYESFKQQLKDMGYTNPMAMGLVCVRNDVDVDAVMRIPSTPEGAVRIMKAAENALVPAFVPIDPATGLPFIERGADENPVDWLYTNSFQSPDYADDRQIKYLYDMARQNRLLIKSDAFDVDRFGKNRYVRVQEDGSAGVTLSFDKMLEEYQRNNNAPNIAGYTNEEFLALKEADSASSTPEYSIDMFVDTVGMYIRNEISSGKQLTVEEQLAIDRFNKASRQNIGLREALINAHIHPDWHRTAEESKQIFELCNIARRNPESLTKEETQLRQRYQITDETFAIMEKGLRKLGIKNIEEAFSGEHIRLHDSTVLTAENSKEFAAKFAGEAMSANELWIKDKPYYFKGGVGFVDGVNKTGYLKEIDFLTAELKKTEGNLTKNSPQYDTFSASLKGLHTRLENISRDGGLGFDKLSQTLNEVVVQADAYMDAHKNKTLDPRQTRRVKVMNRLKDLAAEAAKRSIAPGKNLDYRIAEKIYTAAVIQNKTPNVLMNAEDRAAGISQLMKSELFTGNFINLSPENKQKLLEVSGEKLVSAIRKSEEKAMKEMHGEVKVNVSSFVR